MSTLRLICSGVGLTLFLQMDKQSFYESFIQSLSVHSKKINQNQNQIYEKEVLFFPTHFNIRSFSMCCSITSICVAYLYKSKLLDSIMYVTQKKFNTKMDTIKETIENVKKKIYQQIHSSYDNIIVRLGIVESKLTDEITEVKKEMLQSFQNIESKLHTASLERKYANEGIHLLCKSISENDENNNNKLHEFSSIPMAQFIGNSYYTYGQYNKFKESNQFS